MEKYFQFINECRGKLYECATHKHHIVPKFMGGADDPDNVIKLSYDDHLQAHMILADCFPDGSKERVGSNKSYYTNREEARVAFHNKSKCKSCAATGRIITEEMKIRMSNSAKVRDNANVGKHCKDGRLNPNSKKIQDLKTGIIYNTINELRRSLDISHDVWHKRLKHSNQFQLMENR